VRPVKSKKFYSLLPKYIHEKKESTEKNIFKHAKKPKQKAAVR